ncbi:MAG: endo-1,4-beta-xylanase [Halanaerobiales bacterium]
MLKINDTKLRLILQLFMVITVLSLSVISITVNAETDQEIPSLAEVYEEYYPIGAAVNSETIHSHSEILIEHFNSVTAENEMKPDHLQPQEGNFTFDRADEIVHFARENDMKVRGHVLVWHSQTPNWMFQDNGETVSREVLLERMKTHITTVMEHFKDDVYAWDVVNEAISDGSGIYREESPWYQIIGEDFIKYAFEYAHQADPDAKLFYNDYNAANPRKMNKIYNMLKELVETGVPIDGVGLQGHWNIADPSIIDIMKAIEKYSSLGLEVQITELDMSVFPWGDDRKLDEPTEDMMEKQANKYNSIFNVFNRNSESITGVTLWGVADDETWLDNFPVQNRKNWPLLFDYDHHPKDAFWKVIEAAE